MDSDPRTWNDPEDPFDLPVNPVTGYVVHETAPPLDAQTTDTYSHIDDEAVDG